MIESSDSLYECMLFTWMEHHNFALRYTSLSYEVKVSYYTDVRIIVNL